MATFKKNTLLSAAYTAYAFLVLFLLNPFVWLPDEAFFPAIITSGVTILLLSFILFQFFEKLFSGSRFELTYPLIGLIVSPLIAAFLTFYIFDGAENKILYYITFLLISIPAAAFSILSSLFSTLKRKIYLIDTSESSESEENLPHLKLTNNQGKVILNVSLEKVICFEANDNYVITHFLNEANEKVRSTDRISLKRISESLETLQVGFERVHKSFLINPNFVEKVSGRSQAYKLTLQHLKIEIPVSRKYDISILKMNHSL